MFQTVELGRKVSRSEYNDIEPVLREELLQVQQELRAANFPVILVFAGVDGAGKGETVNLLNEWMDPHWLITHAYTEPSQEEQERPDYWRYWRDLPPKGRIGMFLRGWYSKPLLDRAYQEISVAEFDERLDRIVAFEDELAQDGALILKFWMHLSKAAQKKRLRTLEKDPLLSWQVSETDWRHWHMYDEFIQAAERYIMRTSTGSAPWQMVEGEDARYRGLTVGMAVRDAIRKHLERTRVQHKVEVELARDHSDDTDNGNTNDGDQDQSAATVELNLPSGATILSALDMSKTLVKSDYKRKLKESQAKLNEVYREAHKLGVSSLLVFEGWDAGGKGGAVRRITSALQAWDYEVIPFAAPTDEENAHHYLWRFWRRLGRAGRVTIFDRSWYGRVLVERIEGFATEDEWQRAYAEINDFEEQLVQHGIVLLKFWLHITAKEQLNRFKSREETPYKRWKLTDEDWRNREQWSQYETAVHDMVQHTSTQLTPWTLLEGNDKRYARIKVLDTFCTRLQEAVSAAKPSTKKNSTK
jgi:polyphosphate:AMP phosphotransferase